MTQPTARTTLCLPSLVIIALAAVVVPSDQAAAQQAPIGLGTADNFAVLSGQGVTNTGPTTINGDLGTWPNPSVTGAGLTVTGSIHAADAVAQQAQADTTIAYNDAAGRTPVSTVATELGGQTLTAGAYNSSSGTFEITGPLTLNAQGDPNAVFVFQAASTLLTASASTVNLVNGATACNVFWQVGSSATLGTNSTFRGTVLALASITVTTGVTIEGRALARNGAVTLNTDTITRATCAPPETTSATISSSVNPSDVAQPVTFTSTVTGAGGRTPTGRSTYLDNGTPLGTVSVVNGQATLTTAALSSGSHTITAVYLGTIGFDNSASPGLTQVVRPQQVTTTTGVGGLTTTTTAAAGSSTTTTSVRTTTPAPATSTGIGGPGGSTTSLPRTGRNLDAAIVAGLLITCGIGLLVPVRRKRPTRPLS